MTESIYKTAIHAAAGVWRNPNPPSPPVPDWFVKELSEIGGRSIDGRPILRIVWPGDQWVFKIGRMRIKYPAFHSKVLIGWGYYAASDTEMKDFLVASKQEDVPAGAVTLEIWDFLDTAPNHFIIEELVNAKIASEHWEAHRWKYYQEKYDVLGPMPAEGFYDYLWAMKTDEGEPIPPCDFALEKLRKFRWIRDNDPIFSKFGQDEYPPPEIVEGLVRNVEYETMEQAEEYQRRQAEEYEREMMEHVGEFYNALNIQGGAEKRNFYRSKSQGR